MPVTFGSQESASAAAPHRRVSSALHAVFGAATARAGPARSPEQVYLATSLWVLATGWVALLLGELGLFSLPLLLAIELAGLTLALWLGRRRLRTLWPIHRPDLPDALCGLLLLAAAAYYLRPFELVLGALDPGVYVNTGASIARTGAITIRDQDFLALPSDLQDALFREPTASWMYGRRMEGFYVSDRDQGLVSPHGFHLYPSLLAVGFALGGVLTELLVTPLLALLGLAGLYLLARRLFGAAVGLLAVFLLATNFAQTWFGRYPAAEILVQLLLWSGFLALLLMLDTGKRRYGLAAGLLLGATHLAKVEGVLLPAVVGGFLLYEAWGRRFGPPHRWLVAGYAVAAAHAGLHAWLFARPYTVAHLGIGLAAIRTPMLVFLVLALAVVAALGLRVRSRASGEPSRIDPRLVRALRLGLALGVCLLAAYAWLVRPIGTPTGAELASLPLGAVAAASDRQSLIRLGWYLTPPGVLAGVLGLAVLAARDANRRGAAILALILVESVWYLYEGRIVPLHFWAARRWIPVVIPGFVLLGSYFVVWLLQIVWLLRKRRHEARASWPAGALSAALTLSILALTAQAHLPLLRHKEYGGATAQVERLAALFPEDAVVLFDDDDVGLRLSAPLQHVWGRTSIIVRRDGPAAAALERAVARWEAQGRLVYWVRWERPTDPAPAAVGSYRLAPASSALVDLAEVVPTVDRRPDTPGGFRAELQVYELTGDR